MEAVSSQRGLERWDQLAKKRSNGASTCCLWLVSLAGAVEKEDPANPPGRRLHAQSCRSSVSKGWVKLGWSIPFGFGPGIKIPDLWCGAENLPRAKEEENSLPRQRG